MHFNKKQIQGVTLLESLLVLAIISAILFLGVRQYNSFRLYGETATVQSNVDSIFSGLAQYYRSNCYGTMANIYNSSDSAITPTYTPGTLNTAKTQTTPYAVNVATDLSNAGYMQYKLSPSTLVNTASASAYIAQFNPSPPQAQQICIEADTGTSPYTCTTQQQTGTIVSWTAQVSVLMKDTTKASTYGKLMGADCTSTLNGTYVNPCSSNTPGPYVVWQRQPSFASTQANSTYWPSMPVLKQFTQMYQSEQQSTSASSNHSPEYQYFYCGN